MGNAQTVRTLNELIVASRDGEKGFRACAEHTQDPHLRDLLIDRAQACAAAVEELQTIVRELGGEPANDASTSCAMRCRWLNVRAALSSSTDATIVAEYEKGEVYALETYRNALDEYLPDFVRNVVLRQFEGVVNNCDRIRG